MAKDDEEALDQLVEFYEDLFSKAEEKRRGQPRMIGAEVKFPIVDEEGDAIEYRELLRLYDFLMEKGFKGRQDPYTGDVKEVYRKAEIGEDVVGVETGHCKLELSIAPEENISDLEERYEDLKSYLVEYSKSNHIYFLCHGTQPRSQPGRHLRMGEGRHLYWEKLFGSNRVVPEEAGSDVDMLTLNATCQAHVDLKRREIIDAFNVLNGFVPAQIALNAHSAIWRGEVDSRYKAVINMFWEWWLPGTGRVGIPPRKPEDLRGYVRMITDFSPVFIKREGQYLALPRYKSFREYFAQEEAVAEDIEGNEVEVVPEFRDVLQHNTFFWHDIRISRYATLENRVNCQQPPGEQMVIPALSLGLLENLEEAKEVIDSYSWEEIKKARYSAIEKGMEAEIAGEPILGLCKEMVNLARQGLESRKLGEERYLEPLYRRLEKKECPADVCIQVFKEGGVKALMEKLALR